MTNANYHAKIFRRGLLSLYIVLAIFLSSHVQVADGFAAWLKCWIYLEEGDVIMNHGIIPANKSREPEVKLEAYQNGIKSVVFDNDDDESSFSAIPFSGNDETFQIRLSTPSSLVDVQFVVETTDGANFVGNMKTIMCEGKRAHARGRQGEVILKIRGETDKVEVWAGWATGHEAVTLTERLVFHRREGSHDGSSIHGDSATTEQAQIDSEL